MSGLAPWRLTRGDGGAEDVEVVTLDDEALRAGQVDHGNILPRHQAVPRHNAFRTQRVPGTATVLRMRVTRAAHIAFLLAALVGGCNLGKSDGNSCSSQPGLTTGGQQVCTRPAPTQFDPMGK